MFKKGETVFYSPVEGNWVRARVTAQHRNGDYAVLALFNVDRDGNDRPGYLGYTYTFIDPIYLHNSAADLA